MKVIRVHSYGGPEQILYEDTPLPSIGPEKILVRIRAAGVNPVDWKIREGLLAGVMPKEMPFTLGQDFSGEIVEVGEDVKVWKVGDEVFGFAEGTYAEYAPTSPEHIARKPRRIDFEAAAGLPTPALTAYQIVAGVLQISEGQTVLIHGAAGGVGSLATQLCGWRGAHVIATAAAEDFTYLKEHGAERLIDFKTEGFFDRVKDVDAVIDLVGGETLSRSYQVIKNGGSLVTTVGPLNEAEAVQRKIRGIQFFMSKNAQDLAAIAQLVDEGILKPRLDRVIPMSRAREAQEQSQSGRTHGKVILEVWQKAG